MLLLSTVKKSNFAEIQFSKFLLVNQVKNRVSCFRCKFLIDVKQLFENIYWLKKKYFNLGSMNKEIVLIKVGGGPFKKLKIF